MEPVKNSFHLQLLLTDIQGLILHYLYVKDAAALSNCNRALHQLIDKNKVLWKRFFIENQSGFLPNSSDFKTTYRNCYLTQKNFKKLSVILEKQDFFSSPFLYLPENILNHHFYNGIHYELKNGSIIRTEQGEVKQLATQDTKLHNFSDSLYATSSNGVSYPDIKAVAVLGNDTLTIWKDLTPIFTTTFPGLYQIFANHVTCYQHESGTLHTWNLETKQKFTFQGFPDLAVVGVSDFKLFCYTPFKGFQVFSLKDESVPQNHPFPQGFVMYNYDRLPTQINDQFMIVFDQCEECWIFPLADLAQGKVLPYGGWGKETEPVLEGNYVYFIDNVDYSQLNRINLQTKEVKEVTALPFRQFLIKGNRIVVNTEKWFCIFEANSDSFKQVNSCDLDKKNFVIPKFSFVIQNGVLFAKDDHNLIGWDLANGNKIAEITMKHHFEIKDGYIAQFGDKTAIHNLLHFQTTPKTVSSLLASAVAGLNTLFNFHV